MKFIKKTILLLGACVLVTNQCVIIYAEESINTQAYVTPIISDVSIISVDNGSYTIEGTVSDASNVEKILFPTWSSKNGQDDLLWGKGVIEGNKVTYTVDFIDHNYEVGVYNTHIYIYDKAGNATALIGPSQELRYEGPSVDNMQVIDVQNGRYTIEATIDGDITDRVIFPSWTKNKGQDDITWGEGIIEGNKVRYTVDMGDHNFETGIYNTHIYVYDKIGNLNAVVGPSKEMQYTAPSISNIKITNILDGRYTVEANISGYDIDRVYFPTWTKNHGQDDIYWGQGIIAGNKVTYTIDIKDHAFEVGDYATHIQAYDKTGNVTAVIGPGHTMKSEAAKISDIKVSEVSNGKYKVEAKLRGGYFTDKVLFPTWTVKNGQDDLYWGEGQIVGDKVSYTIDLKDHNFEKSTYNTHIYVYDKSGSISAEVGPSVEVMEVQPKISGIKIINSTDGKYTVEATIKSQVGIEKVYFPTWTTSNGQDDLYWGEGTISGDKVRYTIDMKDHSYESGMYNTHVYAYDKSGDLTSEIGVSSNIKNDPPQIKNINVINDADGSYTIDVEVYDEYGMDKVGFPTWSDKNGQDDMTWEFVEVVNGKAQYTVNAEDHNYESGKFYTHIYAYDKAGSYSALSFEHNMKEIVLSPGWKIINGRKYLFNQNGNTVDGAHNLVVDISEWNGDIDWVAVKNSGVDAVILRCGYGWNDNLEEQRDNKFLENALELERLGIPYGVYLFSYVNTPEGALKEAEYTLKLIAGRKISLPVYYDLEHSDYAGDVSRETYIEMAKVYCERIKQSGYTPGVYANLNYWNTKLNDSSLNKYERWVAQYNSNNGLAGHCEYNGYYKMWQYTSLGQVPGITGNVDMNALYD